MRTHLLAASGLALLTFAACTDDDAPDLGTEFPGRVPCASDTSQDGVATTARTYVYDQRKRLQSLETHLADGAPLDAWRYRWDGYHVTHLERDILAGGVVTPDHVADYTWSGGLLRRVVRRDLDPSNGDRGYTAAAAYDGQAEVEERWDWSDPDVSDTITTIGGDRTRTATWRTCNAPADGAPCSVCVWTQPDSDPMHWTHATCDWDDDGVVDQVYDRTLDASFLDLSFTSTLMVDGVAKLDERELYQREPDGTLLEKTQELFIDGVLDRTYREVFRFACPAARPVSSAARPPFAGDVDAALPPAPRLAERRGLLAP